ncbi:hypothetical protein B0J14DRAFT_643610 [Halenospora varia]|nr:hypothetical protein B0J14DRAFT_643610 [Halenospora varia]
MAGVWETVLASNTRALTMLLGSAADMHPKVKRNQLHRSSPSGQVTQSTMEVINSKKMQFEPASLKHRGGGIDFKILFEGDENSPNNYQMAFVQQKGFYSPIHKHNFDQLRYAWTGNFSITPSLTIEQGELSYHPEGVEYGPQDDGDDTRVLLILQFGGASGEGYLSKKQLSNAYTFLEKHGCFEKGKYISKDGAEIKDAYQALWEHEKASVLEYSRPRYHCPILMSPKNFTWIPVTKKGCSKASRKLLGTFSERGVTVAEFKLHSGGHMVIEAQDATQFLSVLSGSASSNGKHIEVGSVVRVQAGQGAGIFSSTGVEILHYLIPTIPQATVLPATLSPNTEPRNIIDILRTAAKSKSGITVYPPGGHKESYKIGYNDLLSQSQERSKLLSEIPGVSNDTIFLLHFDEQIDNIQWFWAVTIGGFLPALSAPLLPNAEQRRRHLGHLQQLLRNPIVLTKNSLLHEFSDISSLRLHTIESLESLFSLTRKQNGESYINMVPYIIDGVKVVSLDNGNSSSHPSLSDSDYESSKDLLSNDLTRVSDGMAGQRHHGSASRESEPKKRDEIAVLMLTSGSTGSAKAVCLRHEQLIQAVRSKAVFHGRTQKDVFLSWIGMDHVANLVEIHLHAISLCADQIQVSATDVSVDPTKFLQIIDRYRVSYTFAPNFFLAQLLHSLPESPLSYELSCLEKLISGGEMNVVATGAALVARLSQYGLPPNAITPGFGMTETCAGSIYSNKFPTRDIERNVEFAELGFPIPTLEMRIVIDEENHLAASGEIGELHLRAFTSDGWFITGDKAYLDSGRLNLAGRSKETIIINGVNHYPHQIESALEEASIPGTIPSYYACFSHRPSGAPTESYIIIYASSFEPGDLKSRSEAQDAIVHLSTTMTSVKPFRVIPLSVSILPKSSLGKLSRLKLRSAFENGEYDNFVDENDQLVRDYKKKLRQPPTTKVEFLVASQCANMFNVPLEEIGVDSSIFELGATSITLFALRETIQTMVSVDDIPMAAFLTRPTIRAIALGIETILQAPRVYDPVVPLQTRGSKTPLWFLHPGSGDALVFVAISKYFHDRPCYGLRTRGFNAGESFFTTIHEATKTYHSRIKAVQPSGPYALAGYSLGSTLAFELARILESNGDEVRFLGLFDSPPHIAPLIAHTDWVAVALNVAYFLELVPQARANELVTTMRQVEQNQVVHLILDMAPIERVEALAMNYDRLTKIVEVTNAFRLAALQYTCEGSVGIMDVFFVDPLQVVSPSREHWVSSFLKDWEPFCREKVKFHECSGDHALMFNEPFAKDLQKQVKKVLKERNL